METSAELLILKKKFEQLSAGPVLFRQIVMECPQSWNSISLADIPLPSESARCSRVSESIWEPGQPQLHTGWKYQDVIGTEIKDIQSKTSSGTFEQIGHRLASESAAAREMFWDLYQRCSNVLQQRPDAIWYGVPRLSGGRRITAEILHRLRPRLKWYLHPQRYPYKDLSRDSGQRWVSAPPDQWQKEECRVWMIDDFAADAALTLDILIAAAGDKGRWSEPGSPSEWAKRFGMSWDTLKKLFDSQKIRNKKLSTKSYRVHADDLPSLPKSV